ncbi:PREDICTED: uncharacterized protein LOC106819402 [Priapulus caudatus]|uniref:Uncharacterized protein LOC106819402 n=1 Tax=Priapulus caudatus TaxID=37621 RepID=A0ABM1F508_PRICU|nr:PREDICTED: uncharacterized protein LOC106819402 [Priapulus caudatus]
MQTFIVKWLPLVAGDLFSYGETTVTYVAYDAANNTAICTFTVYVLRFYCEKVAAPKYGLAAFSEWDYGRFAVITCLDPMNYAFPSLPPPFYACGREGSWDPQHPNDPFTFPACSRE